MVPSEQASFLEGLGLQHVSTVSFGNTRFNNQSEDGRSRRCVAVVRPVNGCGLSLSGEVRSHRR